MAFLDNLRSTLQAYKASLPTFDPTVFGHPLAAKTEWSPLRGGGTNIRTHKGSLVSPDRFEFSPTIGLYAFAGVFALIGGVAPLVLYAKLLEQIHEPVLHVLLLFPVVFLGSSWYIGRHLGRPVVFDRREGWFWKGRTSPSEDPSVGTGKDACSLSEIKALQLLPESVHSKNGSYTSWEINLVLSDGSRRNVVDHGSETAIREDAAALASFLSVPLWNHSDGFRPTP
jgi:hypothetical protein